MNFSLKIVSCIEQIVFFCIYCVIFLSSFLLFCKGKYVNLTVHIIIPAYNILIRTKISQMLINLNKS